MPSTARFFSEVFAAWGRGPRVGGLREDAPDSVATCGKTSRRARSGAGHPLHRASANLIREANGKASRKARRKTAGWDQTYLKALITRTVQRPSSDCPAKEADGKRASLSENRQSAEMAAPKPRNWPPQPVSGPSMRCGMLPVRLPFGTAGQSPCTEGRAILAVGTPGSKRFGPGISAISLLFLRRCLTQAVDDKSGLRECDSGFCPISRPIPA